MSADKLTEYTPQEIAAYEAGIEAVCKLADKFLCVNSLHGSLHQIGMNHASSQIAKNGRALKRVAEYLRVHDESE